nr:redoxin domain-containing protein [Ktedonobacterales bacterium]
PHCRAQAVQLRRDEPRLRAADLAVVLIGLGTPEEARDFRTRLALPFPILSDPERLSYRRYGLLRMSGGRESNPRGAVRLVKAIVRYGGAYSAHQDMTQLGGVFVVDRAGLLRFVYRSERTSDHPPTADLIRAVTPSPGAIT